VVAIDNRKDHNLSVLYAGSANLTGAATGASAKNFEAGIIWDSPLEVAEARQFNEWWQEALTYTIEATKKTIQRYARAREKFLKANPIFFPAPSDHHADSVKEARFLWIEAGPMRTGGSHNAVEFNFQLASFFGQPDRESHIVTIMAGDRTWADRPISPKVTGFGVKIWRLSLPTRASSGFEYSGKVVSFTKVSSEDGIGYRLEVAEGDSERARQWQSVTQAQGSVGRTGGGHMYGFMLRPKRYSKPRALINATQDRNSQNDR
jgi:hypothetical protein